MAELDAFLDALARRVLAEAGASPAWRMVGVEAGAGPFAGPDGVTLVSLAHHGEVAGGRPAFVGDDAGDEGAVEAFVDQVYTVVVEESGGTVMRPCPGHRHPSWPRYAGGELTWTCPEEPAADPR